MLRLFLFLYWMSSYFSSLYRNYLLYWLFLTFRKATAEKCIVAAAKLISPVIENSFDAGFDWLDSPSIFALL